MSLTVHFITNNWELVDITLDVAEIKGAIIIFIQLVQIDHGPMPYDLGAHNTTNFGTIILEYLKKYNLPMKLCGMEANNLGTNTATG